MSDKKTSPVVKALAVFIGALFLFIVYAAMTTTPSASTAPSSKRIDEGADPISTSIRISNFEQDIKKDLRDPDSYQRINAASPVNEDVCVAYRSKNGFGGYVEGRALYVKATNTYYMLHSDNVKSFTKLWHAHCQ